MPQLSDFAIGQKWPAQHPERLQLYSLATPHGVKASLMLEEIGLPYEPHRVSFATNDPTSPAFLLAECRPLLALLGCFVARPAVLAGLAVPAAPQAGA